MTLNYPLGLREVKTVSPSLCHKGKSDEDRSFLRKAMNIGSRPGPAYDGERDSGCTYPHHPYTTAREGRLYVAHDPSPCCRERLMIDRSYLRKATNVGSRLGSAYDGEGDSGCTCYHKLTP